VLLTVAAICPDQIGQAIWTWGGPGLALTDPARYLVLETKLFRWITGWGGGGYLCAAFGWTWCFAAAGVWSRRMTILLVATWGLFAVSVAIAFVPDSVHDRPGVSKALSGINAIAFVLLLAWIADAWRLTRQHDRRKVPTL
jgi:FtsH-binding integral membrane protein